MEKHSGLYDEKDRTLIEKEKIRMAEYCILSYGCDIIVSDFLFFADVVHW